MSELDIGSLAKKLLEDISDLFGTTNVVSGICKDIRSYPNPTYLSATTFIIETPLGDKNVLYFGIVMPTQFDGFLGKPVSIKTSSHLIPHNITQTITKDGTYFDKGYYDHRLLSQFDDYSNSLTPHKNVS